MFVFYDLLRGLLGPDGGKFDYVIVSSTTDQNTQQIQCFFTKFLDNGDYEMGIDCVEIALEDFTKL